MRTRPTPDERRQIIEYFMAGNSVNHTIFRMGFTPGGGYRFDADDVNRVLREEIERLRQAASDRLVDENGPDDPDYSEERDD